MDEIKLRQESLKPIQLVISNTIGEPIRELVRQPNFILDLLLKEIERCALVEGLSLTKNRRKKAAKILGITFRSIRYRTTLHQLPKKQSVSESLLKVPIRKTRQSSPKLPHPISTLTILDKPTSHPDQLVRWRCEKGHEFRATSSQVKRDSLCPRCCVEWDLAKKSA